MKKKDYLLIMDDIELRRANENDNMEELASLVYQTDPYIYPFWFNNDVEKAKEILTKYIQEKNFIYYYENMYIAYNKTTNHIVGLICAIDYTTDLNYDYSVIESMNKESKKVVNSYIKELIDVVNNNKTMYIVNCSVDKNYRGKRIGTVLFGNFLKQMESAGFDTFEFDCLLHNCRAKNLYHSLGFKEMYTSIGFNGTENPTYPEIVYFKRKTGDSLLGEFTFDDKYTNVEEN